MRAIGLLVGLFLVAVVSLTSATAWHYPGNWLVYVLFASLSNALLIRGFQKGAIYFDTFIGIFVWLGFWLKFSVRVTFTDGLFNEAVGAFDGSPAAFDKALIVSSCGIAAFLVASPVRQYFFRFPNSPTSCMQSGLFQFYRAHRKPLISVFLIVVVLVAASNAALGIYQRGMVAQTVLPFGLNGIYKWLLQFGLASISAMLIRFEMELRRDVSLIAVLPPLVECFLSNTSLLSRGMILNATGLAIGGIRMAQRAKARISVLIGSLAVAAFVGLFVLSVFSVNFLRAKSLGPESSDPEALVTAQRMTGPLIIDRWVGIEGVMAVSSSDKLGWDLWREALAEKYEEGRLSIYDREFIDSPYNHPSIDRSKHHFVSLPGIVAFFYYPGSLGFLFVCLFVLGLVAAAFELVTYRLGGGNWVLCSLFAQVIAFRYVSFGYVPAQSYLLFGSLVLNILIIFVIDRLLTMRLGNRRQLV